MKQVKITETKELTYWLYEAIDGTKFETERQCEEYEKSALCVLNQRYKNYVVHHGSEYDIWKIGSEEYELDLVVVPAPDAIDHILQMYAYYEPNRGEQQYSEIKDIIQNAYVNNHTLIIERGYNGKESFYIENKTLEERIHELKKLGKCD